MRGLSLIDVPFISDGSGLVPLTYVNFPNDSFEGYSNALLLEGLKGGQNGSHLYTINWVSPYVVRAGMTGLKASDDLEAYSNSAALNGLNNGAGWTSAFVDR